MKRGAHSRAYLLAGHEESTLESVPGGLHPVEGTCVFEVCEEMLPMGATHTGELCRELSPVEGTLHAGAMNKCEEEELVDTICVMD